MNPSYLAKRWTGSEWDWAWLDPQPSPLVPADVLDVRNWYLTLPTKDPATGIATNVFQPALATYSDQWFHASVDGTGVIFTANCGGAHTTTSTHERSEFRERYNDGVAQAAWSTSIGVHVMTIKGAVLALSPAKPETVFGQIHDASTYVMTLIAVESSGTVQIVYDLLGSRMAAHLDDNYTLGTPYEVTVTVDSDVLTIHYNGTLIDTQALIDTGCYFKAGDYTQSNTENYGDAPDAYARTVITELDVSHTPYDSVDPGGTVTSSGCGTGYAT